MAAAFARLTSAVVAAGGCVVVPETASLLRAEAYAQLFADRPEPSLGFAQLLPRARPGTDAGGVGEAHVMEARALAARAVRSVGHMRRACPPVRCRHEPRIGPKSSQAWRPRAFML